jgi:hypothetical protein
MVNVDALAHGQKSFTNLAVPPPADAAANTAKLSANAPHQ